MAQNEFVVPFASQPHETYMIQSSPSIGLPKSIKYQGKYPRQNPLQGYISGGNV